jgi:hypothetical protein
MLMVMYISKFEASWIGMAVLRALVLKDINSKVHFLFSCHGNARRTIVSFQVRASICNGRYSCLLMTRNELFRIVGRISIWWIRGSEIRFASFSAIDPNVRPFVCSSNFIGQTQNEMKK